MPFREMGRLKTHLRKRLSIMNEGKVEIKRFQNLALVRYRYRENYSGIRQVTGRSLASVKIARGLYRAAHHPFHST